MAPQLQCRLRLHLAPPSCSAASSLVLSILSDVVMLLLGRGRQPDIASTLHLLREQGCSTGGRQEPPCAPARTYSSACFVSDGYISDCLLASRLAYLLVTVSWGVRHSADDVAAIDMCGSDDVVWMGLSICHGCVVHNYGGGIATQADPRGLSEAIWLGIGGCGGRIASCARHRHSPPCSRCSLIPVF